MFSDTSQLYIQLLSAENFRYLRKYQIALMGKTPHVGIIGAGVSGLRCADILAQNGAKVTILEARECVLAEAVRS